MNTMLDGESANAIRRFTITITLDGVDSETLMRLVSAFHRRQIEILQTTYERVASAARMVVSVEATDARVRTTALTLRNTIGVIECEVTLDVPAVERVRARALSVFSERYADAEVVQRSRSARLAAASGSG